MFIDYLFVFYCYVLTKLPTLFWFNLDKYGLFEYIVLLIYTDLLLLYRCTVGSISYILESLVDDITKLFTFSSML